MRSESEDERVSPFKHTRKARARKLSDDEDMMQNLDKEVSPNKLNQPKKMNQDEELEMLLGNGTYNNFGIKKKDEKLLFDDMPLPSK